MEYLNHVLGICVAYKNELKDMPNYIHARYRVQKVTLDGKEAVFVYPKNEMDAVNAIKKHFERIERTVGTPAILVLDHLTYRQKEYLLRAHIPFVVEGKQIYLPFMAIYLQERSDGEKPATMTMLPSAQLLLLYYIYHGCGELLTSDASQSLAFTATSISRASRQLEEMGLIQMEKRGVHKVIISNRTPEELFVIAKEHWINPVKRTIYVSKTDIKEELLASGYTALSEYSRLNPPALDCRAANSVAIWEKSTSGKLQDSDDQCAVELWCYDPRKLTDGGCVDSLSLAIALREDRDERIEEAVEEMLMQTWRDIDGKRN